jgi:alpha-D-xyloside xylohydrolase
MFGPGLMISPVYAYKVTSRQVYLPSHEGWYDLYSGRYFKGGQTIQADAPYGKIPVFVKAGSIIPTGPELQYTVEKPADPLRIFVYTGANGSFDLYEDEGINYNYELGKFAKISFGYDEKTKSLTIGKREGSFLGMAIKRTIQIIWIKPDRAIANEAFVNPDEIISYDGREVVVRMD